MIFVAAGLSFIVHVHQSHFGVARVFLLEYSIAIVDL